MKQYITHLSLLVRDYDEAIAFYTQKLKFILVEDTELSASKRWVTVAPPGSTGCNILLAKAEGETQNRFIGNQSGGRVFLFLYTDDIARDIENLKLHDVEIIREPITETYGTVLVFADLYGNLWDLIEPVPNKALL